jgi:large subunit ribosomal protein L14
MIYSTTVLKVCDNSGILFVKCFKIFKKSSGTIGSILCVSIKIGKFKIKQQKMNVLKGVIVRVRKNISRKTGNYILFEFNELVLFNEKNEPLGKRIFGPLPLELRKKKFLKLLSLGSTFI